MPIIVPLIPFLRRRRPSAPPPGVALTLVTAVYDENDAVVVIEFDRPVSVAAFDGSQVIVRDGTLNTTAYVGSGPATLDLPNMVRITLAATGPYVGADVDLSATANTGIVAVDDGGTWAGVPLLVLPFP